MFGKQSKMHCRTYIACIIACIIAFSRQFLVDVEAIVKGQFLKNAGLSSRSPITAIKNSSVWLHWNYTWGGEISGVIEYLYQSITYTNSLGSTPVEIARRNGSSGILSKLPSITDPINTRIDVISHNSTLVVKNLIYNDSGSKFSSFVQLRMKAVPAPAHLVPVVTLHVNGAPEFRLMPPTDITVSENSTLVIKILMDGNPKPTAIFEWIVDRSRDKSIEGTQLSPYLFQAIYRWNNIPARLCLRAMTTRLRNSLGTSAFATTRVTVLPNLDAVAKPQAAKPSKDCVEVRWDKIESGGCFVRYAVKFKDSKGGAVRFSDAGHNIGSIKKCHIPNNVNITAVTLTIRFETVSRSFTINVSESPFPKSTGGRGQSNKLGIAVAIIGIMLFNTGL